MFLIAAFREGIGWGLAVMFLPFAAMVFLIVHWYEAKKAFVVQLTGFGVACASLWIGLSQGVSGADNSWMDMASLIESGDFNVSAESGSWEVDASAYAEGPSPSGEESMILPEGMMDPLALKGKTLSEVDALLGRPRMRLQRDRKVILNYPGFTLSSEDGRIVTWVEVDEE